MRSACPVAPPGPTELAFFSPSLRVGGAEKVMVTLANGMVRSGVSVTMILSTCEGPFLAQLDPSVRVVSLGAGRVSTSVFRLAAYLKRNRPLAVLSFQTHANLIAIGARAMARVPVRLVVSERSSLRGSAQAGLDLKNRLVRNVARFAYRAADAVTVAAEEMVDEVRDLTHLPVHKVVCIPNPVITPDLHAQAAQAISHPFGTLPGIPLVVSTGRLAPEKDFPTLLRAFALVRREMEAKLVILGEGSSREELESLVHELDLAADVDLPGFQTNPFPFMKAASLYVLCSKYEGLPGALIQAMGVGTPVVSTACQTGPAEILENGRWGSLVPVGDPETLAEAMLATLRADSQPDVADRAGYYSLDRSIAGYLDILDPAGRLRELGDSSNLDDAHG